MIELPSTDPVTEAYNARFGPQPHLPAVTRFFEIRGLHQRGRVGDCLLASSLHNARQATASAGIRDLPPDAS
jgi:hypothetical protein